MRSKVRTVALLCTLATGAGLVTAFPAGGSAAAEAPSPVRPAGAGSPSGPGAPPSADTVGERPRIDGERLLADIGALAHDSMQGRRAGTAGGERARGWVVEALRLRDVPPLGDRRTQPFPLGGGEEGVNVLGTVRGTLHPDRYLVLTAHYDHLGVRDGDVFNGADDNASGTAALVALAGWFVRHPPRHSIVFAALDAEEGGLRGARAFVDADLVPRERILLNVNLDMVSRSEAGELWVAGTHHRPWLRPLVDAAARVSGIRLIAGHDSPDLGPSQDWTLQSDHGVFHQAGVPFLYFGVEDHPGYHRPEDDAGRITPAFYVEAVETVLDVLLLADEGGEAALRP